SKDNIDRNIFTLSDFLLQSDFSNVEEEQALEMEETLEGDWSEKYISLGGPMDNKG
ncbi:Hypothetical predicted protein, partial [Olea europaea subsp. europaea]